LCTWREVTTRVLATTAKQGRNAGNAEPIELVDSAQDDEPPRIVFVA
jgi:hypothetical protein